MYLSFLLVFAGKSVAQSNLYLHFDGVDDHVRYDNVSALLNGTNTVSMTGWFYPDNLNYGGGLMGIRGEGTGTGGMYVLMLSNGQLECRVITASGTYQVVAPAGSLVANQWNHIAWIWNASNLTLYMNGVSIGTATAVGTFSAANRPYAVGKCIFPGYNFLYTGRADEVTLWNKALTAAEVANTMNGTLAGNEANLLLYYKFNQGTPFDDNTFITQLNSETGATYNASLQNFALTGTTSNFGGTLEANFQSINFPNISTKITTDAPFALNAFSSSGLPISYTLVSGPASVAGNTVTLTGTEGEVVLKASQAGDSQYNAAADVTNSFMVVDPQNNLPVTELTNPANGFVYMPSLSKIQLAAKASIANSDAFSVSSLSFQIGSETIAATNHGNGFYTAWWTPPAYGSYNIQVQSSNNFGHSSTTSNTVDVVNTVATQTANAGNQVWVYSQVYSKEVEVTLPTSVGAFNQINGTLNITCPSGGCDPWDRVSTIEVQGHDGVWYEIIRYVTPYGVACNHAINLTDFSSLLQGKVKMRYSLGTAGNGFLYTLNLQYVQGTPTYKYSSVEKLWNDTYAFGDMANLQPCEIINTNFDTSIVEAAKVKLVATGHGWGSNNTGNAAEFHHDYHHIWVNGASTFTHNNWYTCNPNPDSCSPQSGTWTYARAGWCPGSIAQFFDYDLTPNLTSAMELKYILDENYVDLCHPNNPNCVSGTTCTNCNDSYNPHLIVNSYLIRYSNNAELLSVDTHSIDSKLSVYPNPSTGKFTIENENESTNTIISIYNIAGSLIYEAKYDDAQKYFQIDLTDKAKGVYLVKFKNDATTKVHKVVVE